MNNNAEYVQWSLPCTKPHGSIEANKNSLRRACIVVQPSTGVEFVLPSWCVLYSWTYGQIIFIVCQVLTCIRHLLPSFLDATDRRASLGYEYLSSNAITHTKAIGVARVVIQAINIGESLLKSRPFVRFRVQSCDENRGFMPESRTYVQLFLPTALSINV